MKRATAKIIIAHAIYRLRQEAGLDDYGSEITDQAEAERIICFFEELKQGDAIKDFDWERRFEDYRMWQSICDEIVAG